MSAQNISRAWIGIVGILLSSGCFSTELYTESQFLNLPMKERREVIQEYPLDRQIDLYLAAVLTKHPPDLALADSVARGGAKMVPLLTQRLAEERSDVTKMFLIDVFYRMQELGFYPVTSDKQTMALLETQVSSMKDVQWKEHSSELLKKIRATTTPVR